MRKGKKMKKLYFLKKNYIRIGILLFLCVLARPLTGFGSTSTWINQKTGFQAVVKDIPEILETPQREELLKKMKSLTAYGNASVLIYYDPSSSSWLDLYYHSDPFSVEEEADRLIDQEGVLIAWKGTKRRTSFSYDDYKYYPEVLCRGEAISQVKEQIEAAGKDTQRASDGEDIVEMTPKIVSRIQSQYISLRLEHAGLNWRWILPVMLALITSFLINLFLVKRTRENTPDPVDIINRQDGKTFHFREWKVQKTKDRI